jgi:hypothetical protein
MTQLSSEKPELFKGRHFNHLLIIAEVTLSGIELANKIKKGQFGISEIAGSGAMILQVWEAALAA